MRSVTKALVFAPRLGLLAVFGAVALSMAGCAPGPASIAGPVYGSTPDRTAVISVMFDFDSHRIRPEFYSALDAVAAAMTSQELAGQTFEISGHTDRSGRLAYNVALSRLRAQAVRDHLVARGVPPSLMQAQGFGYLTPLDPSHPYSAANRRVEVTSIR